MPGAARIPHPDDITTALPDSLVLAGEEIALGRFGSRGWRRHSPAWLAGGAAALALLLHPVPSLAQAPVKPAATPEFSPAKGLLRWV